MCGTMFYVFMHLLMELGRKEIQAAFLSGVHRVDSLFTGITIFSCEGRNGGVHAELVVGDCGPGNGIRVTETVEYLSWGSWKLKI